MNIHSAPKASFLALPDSRLCTTVVTDLFRQKISIKKVLIPLPPTGFACVFCAKARGGANGRAGQAHYGLAGVNSNFTECKVLRKYAVWLQNGER